MKLLFYQPFRRYNATLQTYFNRGASFTVKRLLLFSNKMALSARLCTRGLLGLQGIRCISVSPCCKKIALQPKAYVPPITESHDEKNMRLCRPQSPHLTIYKFQLPANLSITHRFTGIILSGYFAGLGITSLVINTPMAQFLTALSTSYPMFFVLLKLGIIIPFSYHYFNGIRHLVWDTGNALTLKGVYISGYLMLLFATLAAGGLYYYGDITREKEIAEKIRAEEERAAKLAEEAAKNSKGKKKK